MPTKREIINTKVEQFLTYAKTNNLPFYDELRETSQTYETSHLVALVERYLIPAKDCLEEYLEVEWERCKAFTPRITDYRPTSETKQRLLDDIRFIIKVIEL